MSEAGNKHYSVGYSSYRTSARGGAMSQQPFAQSVLRVYEKLFDLPTFIMVNHRGAQHGPELFVSQSISSYEAQLKSSLQKITKLQLGNDDIQIFPYRFEDFSKEEDTLLPPSPTQFIALMPLIERNRLVAIVGIVCQAESNIPFSSHANTDFTKKLKNFRNLARILVPGLLRILAANDLYSPLNVIKAIQTEPSLFSGKTDRKEIFTVSNIDPLTGLRTRESFEQLIALAIENIDGPDQRVALFYVDLDHLKTINDAHGHAAGDAALVAISNRLKQLESENVIALRLGGDEFALLLQDTRCAHVRKLIEELPKALSPPVFYEGNEISPKVSIGAAVFPQHAKNAKELQDCADAALYHAKKRGRNRASLFNQVMQTRLNRQVTLQQAAKQALLQNEISTVFQPVRSCKTNQIMMLEARTEWPEHVLQIARGNDLSKVFDNASFSSVLGETSLAAIIHTMRTCQNTSMQHWEFLFRVPTPTFLKESFCDDLLYLLQENNLRSDKFILEISSRVLLRPNASFIIEHLDRLTNSGVKLCINHFDSGGLKVEHFQKLNISYIKLHAGLVEKLFQDKKAAHLLTAATKFAHTLNIEIILSEVKSIETQHKLRALSAEYVQGSLHDAELRFPLIYKRHILERFEGAQKLSLPPAQYEKHTQTLSTMIS